MITVIDYDVGNLFSLCNTLKFINAEYTVTRDISEILAADGIILPGVGAFAPAYNKLKQYGLIDVLQSIKDKPIMGICLGMQLLFSKSYEFGECNGLSLIDGEIRRIPTKNKVPHIGYNDLSINHSCALTDGINDGDYVYFVHSFMAFCDKEYISSFVNYGCEVPAIVHKDNIYGCQFHPEKSGEVGVKIMQNFNKLCMKGL